ncbi:hypothetical protein LZ11_01465 [Thermosediminibacter litoriperuensis]|uniref:Uncharacterized protein n=1 Tax=Thermosediminibacter litoriperuensis TaxID=291989 RepID=A0A5S5ARI7_9FIRM|nr:hypothetical protein LZ11_01465 [Thermosediminibacter litoriperuensis]
MWDKQLMMAVIVGATITAVLTVICFTKHSIHISIKLHNIEIEIKKEQKKKHLKHS